MRLYPLQKRNYDPIDSIIREWASENSLQLYTESKAVEIRSVLFCDDAGDVRFHIGIEPLDNDGSVVVQVYEVKKVIWERKSTQPISFQSSLTNLGQTLDEAISLVKSKMA